MRASFRQVAALPGFEVAASTRDLNAMRAVVANSGVTVGDTVIRRARDFANQQGANSVHDSRNVKATVSNFVDPVKTDAWTLPGKSTLTIQPVNKAPAHGGKWKRFVACTDTHGDMQDDSADEVLCNFVEVGANMFVTAFQIPEVVERVFSKRNLFQKGWPITLSFDFNRSPMAAILIQHTSDFSTINIVKEFGAAAPLPALTTIVAVPIDVTPLYI
jgi:hypothetical protein